MVLYPPLLYRLRHNAALAFERGYREGSSYMPPNCLMTWQELMDSHLLGRKTSWAVWYEYTPALTEGNDTLCYRAPRHLVKM